MQEVWSMIGKRLLVALAVVSFTIAAACGDDAPSTNTVGQGSVSPTGSIAGNLEDVTGGTPVAAGDDSIVQGNQPMQSSAVP
jgi:hypothetical protein